MPNADVLLDFQFEIGHTCRQDPGENFTKYKTEEALCRYVVRYIMCPIYNIIQFIQIIHHHTCMHVIRQYFCPPCVFRMKVWDVY